MKVIRSNRKTIAIEILPDASVLVRAPFFVKDTEIKRFVKEKEDWIREHLSMAEARQKKAENV